MPHNTPVPPPRTPSTVSRRTVIHGIGATAALATFTAPGATHAAQPSQPATSHPRLWLTEADLPRIRAWANGANPLWTDGILPIAADFEAQIEAGVIPGEDDGGVAWIQYPTENIAQFFAFLYLVHPDEAARATYGDAAACI